MTPCSVNNTDSWYGYSKVGSKLFTSPGWGQRSANPLGDPRTHEHYSEREAPSRATPLRGKSSSHSRRDTSFWATGIHRRTPEPATGNGGSAAAIGWNSAGPRDLVLPLAKRGSRWYIFLPEYDAHIFNNLFSAKWIIDAPGLVLHVWLQYI